MGSIGAENDFRISQMSSAEVQDAVTEIESFFSDEALQLLRARVQARSSGGATTIAAAAWEGGKEEPSGESATTPSTQHDTSSSASQTAGKAVLLNMHKLQGEDDLRAATKRLPEEERLKHMWMSDVPSSSTTAAPRTTATSTTTAPTTTSVSYKTLFDDLDEDAGGQRWDFHGNPFNEAVPPPLLDHPSAGSDVPDDNDVPSHLGMHHHGKEAAKAGYTIDECTLLAQSRSPQQRVFAVTILARILSSCRAAFATLDVEAARTSRLLATLGQAATPEPESWVRDLVKDQLRFPVHFPLVMCELLSDSTLQVRLGAVDVLLMLLEHDTLAPPASIMVPGSDDQEILERDLEFFADTHGVPGDGWNPFRRLTLGKAFVQHHSTSKMRTIHWDAATRRAEDKDDQEDELAQLSGLVEEVDTLTTDPEGDGKANAAGKLGHTHPLNINDHSRFIGMLLGEAKIVTRVARILATSSTTPSKRGGACDPLHRHLLRPFSSSQHPVLLFYLV